MSEPYASSSVAHKRTYDDLGPEDAPGPSGSRTDPSSSSAGPSTSRDRNKRARNDLDSEFASEIEDILLSSNTSVSSSSSGSSYHSARSNLSVVASPLRLPVIEPIDEDIPPNDVPPARYSPQPYTSIDVSMDEPLFSIDPPPSPPLLPASSPTSRQNRTDAADQLRRAMERATAFDREISALRQSPARPVSPPTPPPVWQSWTAQLPRDLDEMRTPFDHVDLPFYAAQSSLSAGAQNALPAPHTSNSLSPGSPPTPPITNAGPSSSTYPFSIGGEGFPPFELPQYSRPPPSLHQHRLNWLAGLEEDMLGDERDQENLHANSAASRLRDRDETTESFWDRPLLSDRLEPSRPALDSPRLLERRRSYVTVPPAPAARAQMSASPAFPHLHSLVDDYWHREHDREIRNLDHTIREAEVHRQRVANFLAGTESPRLSSTRLTRERASPVAPSSSYSSLRGALDDTAIRRRAHLAPRPQSSSRSRRVVDIREYEPPTISFYNPDYLSHRSADDAAPRSMSQSTTHNDVLDLSPPPEPSYDGLSSYTSSSSLSQGSYLEANRTAREERLISVLRHRHRTRPRSPSPPPPSSSFRNPYDFLMNERPEQRSRDGPTSARSLLGRISQRESPRPASSATRLSFDLPPLTEPERAPALPSIPLPRVRRYGPFDPSAYRAGPFRATMARSMALQIQNERERERDPEPSPFAQDPRRRGLASEPSSSEEDEPYNHYLSLLREVQAPSRQADRAAQSPRSAAAISPVMSRARAVAGQLSRRLLQERQASATTTMTADSSESDTRPTRSAADTQTPTDRLLDLLGRPSAPPVGPRHRTLLSRERSLSSFRDYVVDDLLPPERRERYEQHRREILERRTAELLGHRHVPPPPGNLSGAPPSSAPSQRDDGAAAPGAPRAYAHPHAHTGAHTTLPRRNRASFSVVPPRGYPTIGRGEDRATPLNGRFARARGFGSHHPADMVWIDLPTRDARSTRRRNMGDYLRDDEFDMSYEGLLSLSSLLGDVKPRGTPADVLAALPKGKYSEWATPGETEERCPICLDDYAASDLCSRIPGCTHWFHDGCLQQWLKGSRTCPVCRGRVNKPRPAESTAPVAGPSGTSHSASRGDVRDHVVHDEDEEDDEDDDSERDGERTPRRWSPYRPPWRND